MWLSPPSARKNGSVSDRIALVTGANRGYGSYVARHLTGAGFTVAALGRDEEATTAIADELSGLALIADLRDRDAVDDAIGSCIAQHGSFDVVVNNAGVGGTFATAWEAEPDDWWHTVEVNLRGTHNVTRAVVPGMVAAGRGRIVNVVSHAGTARWPYASAYVVSKAGLIKYGENLAAEVRRTGVVVFNYNPGILDVGLTRTLFNSTPAAGSLDALVAEWFHEQIDTGNGVDADLSAATLTRLAAGDADVLSGRYITAYDDLDALIARGAEIASSNAYTLGLITRSEE